MSQKNLARVTRLIALLLLGAPLVVLADGTDEMWEITTKIEMAGMPMAMPAMTNKSCLPKNRSSEEALVPKDKNSDCKMDSMQQSGNKTVFKMSCSGKNAMTGYGEIEKSADSYRGKMHMVGKMEGQDMDMTQNFSGKKIGSCTYEDVGKKMLAQQQTMTADMCRKSIDELQWMVFKDGSQFEMCKPFKKDFCARVNKVAAGMHDPAGFRDVVQKQADWQSLLGTCAIDTQPLLTDACKKGKDAQDWDFIASYCPADAKALAAEHCAGRDYTAMMLGPYAPLCRSIAREQAAKNEAVVPSKEDAVKAGVSEGVNKLKKLLPF